MDGKKNFLSLWNPLERDIGKLVLWKTIEVIF